ncbi:M23 family metallopeptidase [Salinispira pacifica]|uniref:Membrane-bound lytic murein transglycosylase D n=1 Tax=Salinispira pacifica TaxID=1307761 RepID=V5WIN0_9SPIO|nr:M23 family metallopeptidase [Salinispira pacifica]AHC15485.1 Membrane-bound lytic murein transglycosylase D precursor [Salinispira pacifica]
MPRNLGTTAVLLSLILLSSSTAVAEEIEYTVKSGDTLYSISRSYNIELNTLMSINGIDDVRNLKVGQTLEIPEQSSPEYPLSDYEILVGDTLFSISRRTGMSMEELLRINNIQEDSIIKPGQIIRVRALTANPEEETRTADNGNDSPAAEAGTSEDDQNSASSGGDQPAREGTILTSEPSSGGDGLYWPHEGERYSFAGKFPGIVIKGNPGDAINSVGPGRVVYSGPHSTLGNVVFVQNPRGYIYIYGGNRRLFVNQGDDLTTGQLIGELGASPLLPDVQVYFSVWKEGRYLDPNTAPR